MKKPAAKTPRRDGSKTADRERRAEKFIVIEARGSDCGEARAWTESKPRVRCTSTSSRSWAALGVARKVFFPKLSEGDLLRRARSRGFASWHDLFSIVCAADQRGLATFSVGLAKPKKEAA